MTFTTPHAQVSGIEVSDLTHTSASVTVSLAGADVDKRGYINYWVSRDRSDPERTYYLRYKRETDSAFNGWSDPVTLAFSGSTEVALSGLDPGTVYDVQVYENPKFPMIPPFGRPFEFKEGTWLEELGAFTTPTMPPTLAFEADMTVGTGTNEMGTAFDGYLRITGDTLVGSISSNTFDVGGVQYTVDYVDYAKGTSNQFELGVTPALPYDAFTLTLGSTELSSSSASVTVNNSGQGLYTWSGTDPSWASGATVDVKLDIGLIDICDRPSAVADAIVKATPSFDFCHMTSPLDLDDITELDLSGVDLGGHSWNQLPVGVFDGLDSLEVLDLSDTHLQNLNRGIFGGLDSLIELDLSDTLLQRGSVPVGVFDGLDSLEILRIADAGYRGRGINFVDEDIFRGLDTLLELDVGPIRPSDDVLAPLTSLETLNGQGYTP